MLAGLQTAFAGDIKPFSTSAGVLRSGRDWRSQVLDAIKTANMILLLATPDAFVSKEVCFEIGAAAALDKMIVPARVGMDAAEMPLGLDKLQSPDL